MTRTARQASSTGYYHIIMRGDNRNRIFQKKQYKLDFMEMLEEQENEGTIEMAAWCIMDNHVHLVLKAELDQLSLAMKKINVKFAMRYNLNEKMIGHVFQDRFKSQAIETDEYLLQVIRYVHNNPIKARIIEKPGDYKWSSYSQYINNEITSKRRQFKFVLGLFNNSIDEFKAFHMVKDDKEYLEIKEDLKEFGEEKAQEIISACCAKHGIIEAYQIKENERVMNDLIAELIDKSGMSYRKIARLLEISYNTVREVGRNKH